MTGLEQVAVNQTVATAPRGSLAAWRRVLLFGDGLGLEICGRNLKAAVVRVRPGGASLLAATTIADFRSRPAAEWGAEIARFLAGAKASHLVATIVLPREEVIVRALPLAGVPDKDIAGAIDLQIDTLHPWEGEEVALGWTRVAASTVLTGIVRRAVLTAWETLFSEAGIGVAAVTFSAAAIHSALRLRGAAPASILLYSETGPRLEVYGESEARPLYSAEFNTAPERALAIARAELRLPDDTKAAPLGEALGASGDAGGLAWAAGLVSAAPLTARVANLIPAERRSSHSRVQYAVPVGLGVLLAAAMVTVFLILPAIDQRRTAAALNAEARRLEPVATRAQNLERMIGAARTRTGALADFRARTQADLDVLNELTHTLQPPVWTNQIDILADSVTIAGEAEQAAPLLRLLDSSPLFQNSEFVLSVVRNAQQAEQFRIRTMRRGRSAGNKPGKTTP